MQVVKHVCTDECNPETMDHLSNPGETIAADIPASAYPPDAKPLPSEED